MSNLTQRPKFSFLTKPSEKKVKLFHLQRGLKNYLHANNYMLAIAELVVIITAIAPPPPGLGYNIELWHKVNSDNK